MGVCGSKPVEKCGVAAVYRDGGECIDYLKTTLFELRHRGHESFGTSAYSDEIKTRRYPGMVPEDSDSLYGDDKIPGRYGTGHVRYGTSGSSDIKNAHPIDIHAPFGDFTIAQNGTICNAAEIKRYLHDKDMQFHTETDTELVGLLIAEGDDVIDGYKKAAAMLKGSWCLTVLDKNGVYAMRDPHGFRPLVMGKGKKDNTYVIASEPGAFRVLGLDFLRDIEPGEIIHIDSGGRLHGDSIERKKPAYCAFCRAYFARPDAVIDTTSVGLVRLKLGANLAEADNVQTDFIQGIPDSGTLYAQGAHSKTGERMGTVIMRKRHHRTFILPGDRFAKVKGKYFLLPFKSSQSGKFYEDTIVRGNTVKAMVEWLREEGKIKEVHIRSGTPPVRKPCPYGIDMQNRNEFIIEQMGCVEGVRKFIGADTLLYQTEDGFFDGLGISGIPPEHWCTACWDIGDYPDGIPEGYRRL